MQDSLIGRYCLAKLDEMVAIVAAMDDETANTVPDVPGANSPYQLLTHCLGMAREWTGANILGERALSTPLSDGGLHPRVNRSMIRELRWHAHECTRDQNSDRVQVPCSRRKAKAVCLARN